MSQKKQPIKQKFVVQEKLAQADIYKVNAQSILNKATGFIDAYDFTLNPYRGCQYGCSYCYAAAFSPDANLRQNWGNWVIIKENAQLLLTKELARWHKKNRDRPATIYMSSVTDPYQPIEAKQKLTRALLTVMLQYQPTLVIQTRSPMIVRDLDLLKQFERLRINLSIPTGSELVKQDFEPRSPSIKARLQTISKLRYGYALLIIQGRKLFNMYNIMPNENLDEEGWLIQNLLEELGLKLQWYKYLTATGKRTPMKQGFAQFAKDNLPPQTHLNTLRKKYLQQKYPSNYAIDDYVILAKKA